MKRQCIIFKTSKDFGSNLPRHICVDTENAEEIYQVLIEKEKKFRNIAERILTVKNMYYDCYAKEKVDNKTGNVAAIKFFDADNTRLYCQEYTTKNGLFYIICSIILYRKKVQKNNNKIKGLIKKVASYEYEIV